MNKEPFHVIIGYDTRESAAFEVAKSSLLRNASSSVFIRALKERPLRHSGLFRRKSRLEGTQRIDEIDGKPFSTEFAFTRFLIPAIANWEGWTLFSDCDFLYRADVIELDAVKDDRYAVMVCKQNYVPKGAIKMDGRAQQPYHRKNWSSFILWNNAHPANKVLTPFKVNKDYGSELHGFGWLEDHEIGDIDHTWNWLDGTTQGEPKAVHFSEGGPWFKGYENCAYGQEWLDEAGRIGVGL